MGGSGSGRWDCHKKARTVEGCACIQVLPGGALAAKTWGGMWKMRQGKQGDTFLVVLQGAMGGWKADLWIQIEFWQPQLAGGPCGCSLPGVGRKF